MLRPTIVSCFLVLLALAPVSALAAQWGSSYGDPAGFCPALSWLPSTYLSLPPTNDPSVGNNPEQDTFFGYHPVPGYDDWYGYWYGDFRGRPGDASGWQLIRRVDFPEHWHWNFADWGWAVHGHAKQYIAYYNWTFGGQCGMGYHGSPWPAPYMADVDGYPVLDIYVDSVPPQDPEPRITTVSPASISFGWNAVADRGDGAGADYFAVGMDHYSSWLTVNSGPPQDRADSAQPRLLSASPGPGATVCAHVIAYDKLGNATAPQSACGRPVGAPPLPPAPSATGIDVNPPPPGLAGLETWMWVDPTPARLTPSETVGGIQYRIVQEPVTADWDFGDGSILPAGGFGSAYPAVSGVRHQYAAQSRPGYRVSATVRYNLSWWWLSDGSWLGPYSLGSQLVPATAFVYPVQQAQPELESLG